MNERGFYLQTERAIMAHLWQELKLAPTAYRRHPALRGAQGFYSMRRPVSGPRLLTLPYQVNPRFHPRISALAEQLSAAARLDRGATIRVERGHRGTLVLEIPKPAGLWRPLRLAQLRPGRGVKAVLGLDSENHTTLLDFTDPALAHVLLAGKTGSGKTNVQRLIFHALARQTEPDEARFLLIDTRKRGAAWQPFARLPHLLHEPIIDPNTAARALAWATAEIDRRSAQRQNTPYVFIGVDEVQDLLADEALVKAIADLSSVGREWGLHLVIATQNPTREVLGDLTIKRNMARIVGKTDQDGARAAAGVGGTGAEKLTGKGDMLLVNGHVTRFLAALLTGSDLAALPRVEEVQQLDLSDYEDLDYVTKQANLTRNVATLPDPVEPEHVAFAVTHESWPNVSGRQLRAAFKMGNPKAQRILAFTAELMDALERQGFTVCRDGTAETAARNGQNALENPERLN